jgi:hypothetical protein
MVRKRHEIVDSRRWIWVGVLAIVLGAGILGYTTPSGGLILLLGGLGGSIVLQYPQLGVLAIVPAALIVRFELSTGSAVSLNVVTALVLVLLAIWFIEMVHRGQFRVAPSRLNLPLMLFLAAGLVSVIISSVTWDPAVPRSGDFLIVQFAQWAIFVLSAGVLWLTANRLQDVSEWRRLFYVFIGVSSFVAGIFVTGGRLPFLWRIPTVAVQRAPFWGLLASFTVGQLLFNDDLAIGWRLFLFVVLAIVVFAVFYEQRDTASHWVGVTAAVGVLAWLRWAQLRWLVIVLLIILTLTGVLFSFVYNFAGGEEEWIESGGSRLTLISRVIEVTMRNPITGLGPAAYRLYAQMKPLQYREAVWFMPTISSHNNYVDLFSHVGLLGLGLFLWFAVEVIFLGLRLREQYKSGFVAGYVNGILAAWASALILMVFADWILPFVYNIGFSGFQASILIWLFLGVLIALENVESSEILKP